MNISVQLSSFPPHHLLSFICLLVTHHPLSLPSCLSPLLLSCIFPLPHFKFSFPSLPNVHSHLFPLLPLSFSYFIFPVLLIIPSQVFNLFPPLIFLLLIPYALKHRSPFFNNTQLQRTPPITSLSPLLFLLSRIASYSFYPFNLPCSFTFYLPLFSLVHGWTLFYSVAEGPSATRRCNMYA